jgi:hypothetical protein
MSLILKPYSARTLPKRETLTSQRIHQLKQGYTVKPMDFTEDQTRKAYIDVMLCVA